MVGERVEIGGQSRPVLFGRNALVEFEKIAGFSLLDESKTEMLQSFAAMQALVFVGLKWGLYKANGIEPNPNFTILHVGDWLDEDTLGENGPTARILKIFTESMPGSKKGKAGESPAEK